MSINGLKTFSESWKHGRFEEKCDTIDLDSMSRGV